VKEAAYPADISVTHVKSLNLFKEWKKHNIQHKQAYLYVSEKNGSSFFSSEIMKKDAQRAPFYSFY